MLFFSLHFLLFLNNFFIISILLSIIFLVDGHYFVEDFFVFKSVVGQHLCDIADIDEVILFDLFTDKG
jgi:hypothetical protein